MSDDVVYETIATYDRIAPDYAERAAAVPPELLAWDGRSATCSDAPAIATG